MKIVFVYGFCHKNDLPKVISKILDLCRNIEKVIILCDYGLGENTEDEYWKNYANLSNYTPDYVIGIDCEYNRLDEYERNEIKKHNKPTRIITI